MEVCVTYDRLPVFSQRKKSQQHGRRLLAPEKKEKIGPLASKCFLVTTCTILSFLRRGKLGRKIGMFETSALTGTSPAKIASSAENIQKLIRVRFVFVFFYSNERPASCQELHKGVFQPSTIKVMSSPNSSSVYPRWLI